MGHVFQHRVLFCNEVDKLKDLIHMHSFAHDFHLRCAYDLLGGRTSRLPSDYPLVSFLHQIVRLYPLAPLFSRNALGQGELK